MCDRRQTAFIASGSRLLIVKVALKSPRELAVTEFTLSQFKALHTAPTSDMMISPTSTCPIHVLCEAKEGGGRTNMRSFPSVALDPTGAERCSCTTQYLPTDYPDSLPALGAMMRDREEQKRTYWCICCTHHHQCGSPSLLPANAFRVGVLSML